MGMRIFTIGHIIALFLLAGGFKALIFSTFRK
jgi:hypothetical protein